MTERHDGGMTGIDGPRPLDQAFRARLERALIEEAGVASGSAARWTIDRAREMPSGARARIEAKLARRAAPSRSLMVRMTAAIAALLVASTVIVVTGRVHAPAGGSSGPVIAASQPSAPAAPVAPHGPNTLKGFSSAGAFLRYVRSQAVELVGPYGVEQASPYSPGFGGNGTRLLVDHGPGAGGQPGPMPAQAAPMPAQAPSQGQYSTTNVQEEGVDEPDIVKTDGRRLVFVSFTKLEVLDVTHVAARVLGSLPLQNGDGAFLVGHRVIVVSSLDAAPPAAARAVHVAARPWTKVTIVNIATPTRPTISSSMEIEGAYVGARMVGGIVRLVIRSGALGPPSVPLSNPSQAALDAARLGNVQAIKRSSVGDWVPHFVVERAGRRALTGHVLDWRSVSRPPDPAGLGMLTVLTIDPADPRPNNAVSVIGSGEIVYASLNNLYVTSNSLNDVLSLKSGRTPKEPVTRIHAFDIRDPKRARYAGSGAVPGYLLNQFSLSELDGYLRVASTLGFDWAPDARSTSHSRVTVLAPRGGQLVQVAAVGNIGKGERIFSVRFVGHMGYVVTFHQLDPLFVIDLRTPSRPRVVGRLTVPGYSGYLHPISDTILLGVGRFADKAGVLAGLQLALFDVSNPAAPRRLDARSIGASAFSPVEQDHHAFLYWKPRHLAVIPVTIFDSGQGSGPFIGALAITATQSGFGTPVRITHAGRSDPQGLDLWIQRAIVIGDRLVTLSQLGVLTSDLETLSARAWVPFGA